MTISSPLDLAWDHAYWAEGPEFLAVAPSSGGGLVVGFMSMDRGDDQRFDTWPDEVGTADASTAAAEANQPYYSPASSTFNGRPVVYTLSSDNTDRHLTATFPSALSQPFDLVVIGRLSAVGSSYFVDGSASRMRIGDGTSGGADVTSEWRIDFGINTVGLAGSLSDTDVHLFRARTGAPDLLFVDEVEDITGTAGANTLAGLTMFNTLTGSGPLKGEVAFVGVASTLLSTQDIIDLSAWAASHYGVSDGTAPGSGPYDVNTDAKFWVKADAITGLNDGDAISQWDDQSGNALHAAQATGSLQPLYKTNILNGLPVVRFDGTDDVLATSAPATTVTNNWTMALVVDPNTNSANGCAPLCNGSGSNGYAIATRGNTGFKGFLNAGLNWQNSTTAADTNLGVWVLQRKAGTTTLYVDGVALKSATQTPNAPTTKLTLGFTSGSPAAYLNGDIGEALVFDVALSTLDLNRLGAALASRWGTTWTDIP